MWCLLILFFGGVAAIVTAVIWDNDAKITGLLRRQEEIRDEIINRIDKLENKK